MSPATDWSETIAPDEDTRFADYAARLETLQRARPALTRGLHTKLLAGLRARLIVPADLPAHLKQGLFARAGEHHAYLRWSNGSGRPQHDKAPDLRGLAIKVLGVEGKKALGDALTQDFLLVDTRALAFKNAEQFVGFLETVVDRKGLIGKLIRRFGFFAALGLLSRLARAVKGGRIDVADLSYFGPGPMRFGPYASRLAAFPLHAPSAETAPGEERDYLRQRVRARVKTAPLEFELKVQLYADPASTPIETPTVPWTTPFETVGRLVIDRQDPDSDQGRLLEAHVEAISFDPWHALTEHQPLGATMRARKAAYYASTKARGAAPETDGSEWDAFG